MKLTMISGCGIVTISLPVNMLYFRVRSGRKINVFFISKATVSSSSESTKFVFSFHSLRVCVSVCVVCQQFLGEKERKNLKKFNGANFCCAKYSVLLKNVWTDLYHMRLCVYWKKIVDKIKNPLPEVLLC